ncbi:spore morphogenesis/germination protein YwcE [Metabacillus malikii]|uniref:Membrane protein n=1 Tax=Metabacillus malikii TaxID=1504265 RepID=A0ABT9ZEX3_9BACI|nr:spore morphogenesis/germination protein YwcE [Metabacillus malikii]MDQ0230803.1 putative membrane protein [Metabacillus malikii]
MDVFFAYLLIASASPLFLWKEHIKLAIFQIPVIVAMWIMFTLYISNDYGMAGHLMFGGLFALNVILAHVTVFYVFVIPFFKHLKNSRRLV